MAEMTRRDRILASARGERPDKLPFFHWWRHSQTGAAERECRNRGMGLNYERPPATSTMHGVDITETRGVVDGLSCIHRTYSTPVGSVYEDEYREPGTGQWHGNRSWQDVSPWLASRMIKGPDDYQVVKYIVEHTEYVADYFPIEQALDWLGDEGIVVAILPHSPMQTLMIDWIGSEEGRCFYHLADYPDLVDDLYQAVSRSRQPLYEIAAESPAPVTFWGDNVDGQLVTPSIFERYLMPEYEKQQAYLQPLGKLLAVHMDGRLGVLKRPDRPLRRRHRRGVPPVPDGRPAARRGARGVAGQDDLGRLPGEHLRAGPGGDSRVHRGPGPARPAGSPRVAHRDVDREPRLEREPAGRDEGAGEGVGQGLGGHLTPCPPSRRGKGERQRMIVHIGPSPAKRERGAEGGVRQTPVVPGSPLSTEWRGG